jgi:hypothetical protein
LALGKLHDPRLPASSLDAAILVHMYHEIAQPCAFLYDLAPAGTDALCFRHAVRAWRAGRYRITMALEKVFRRTIG